MASSNDAPFNPASIHGWSGPRSLSTSLMYAFSQRGDTAVVDEPLYAHHLRCTGAERPYRDLVLACQDNDGVRVFTSLLAPRTGERPVLFAKHMAKQALQLPASLLLQGRHFLLLREPAELVRSFARVLRPTLEETGLPSLLTIFSTLRAAGRPPPVILSEDLAAEPEATLRLLCAALSLPFDERMLSWPAGPHPEDGVWAPWWYESVHASTGFVAPASRGGAAREPLSPSLSALAAECAPFYALLRAHALRPLALAGARSAPPPVAVLDVGHTPGASSACAQARLGATHAYVPDERNAGVLVGIRDGVSGLFELHRREHARVSVLDSGFLLGDGVWEGMRLHKGVLLFAAQHLRRLYEGAAAIDLDLGVSRDSLLRFIYAVVDANKMQNGVHIRLMVTRGLKPTPFQDPRTTIGSSTIVVLAEFKAPQPPLSGLRLATVHVRRGAPDVQDPALNSHSKLNCIQACIQASKAGADEALMLDPQGFVATCNSTNFFIARDGELWAPTTRYQMPGVTRGTVLKVACQAGITVRETEFSLTSVYGADEAFVTGTFAGLLPVASVDGRVIGACSVDAAAPMLPRLQKLYAEAMDADVAHGR